MWKRLFQTDADPSALVLRTVLGVVMLPHGAQKLLGWFGGPGLDGTPTYFHDALGIPPVLTLAVIAFEFFGGLALLLGLGSRIAAVGIAAIMIVAAVKVHLPNGFFMDWSGTLPGEGFEYHLLALAIAIAVFVKGSGLGSLDRRLVGMGDR